MRTRNKSNIIKILSKSIMRIMSTTNATENNQEQPNNTKEQEKHENLE